MSNFAWNLYVPCIKVICPSTKIWSKHVLSSGYEDNLKNEKKLKSEDDLKNENRLKNEDDNENNFKDRNKLKI